MKRTAVLLSLLLSASAQAVPDRAGVARSDAYTRQVLDVDLAHSPEDGSAEGVGRYDPLVSKNTTADEDAERRELMSVRRKLQAALTSEQDPKVRQDLQILLDKLALRFRRQDYQRAHLVEFSNASQDAFGGLKTLLDDQVAAERRVAAVTRLRAYAGMDGHKSLADLLRQRTLEQMAKPGIRYPARRQLETEMGRNHAYVPGLRALFEKYNLHGWEGPLQTLDQQLQAYDAWIRAEVLPRSQVDFRLEPEQYALNFQTYGIDETPQRLAAQAHAAFQEVQAEMAPIATEVARQRGWPSADYRDVIRRLKLEQLNGPAILPLYQKRLADIEALIRQHHLLTLPERPAVIKLASQAETSQEPAPHMEPPPFVHNTGQRGVFVLPLNIPGREKYDDFTFDAAAWTLTAHEARPGHELQFDSMVEHGISLARALYAMNSTNVEGWGLYSEWMMRPYMPLEGRLVSLDYLLLRAARAFLDPELQAGKITPEQAHDTLTRDVVQSNAFADEEVERYTYRGPGQACSYFYGYKQLMALRQEVEKKLGERFEAQSFHDFVLAQGLLPPRLMREAVLNGYSGKS